MQTYFESNFVRIDADAKLSVLVLHWKPGRVSPHIYQQALLEGLRWVQELDLQFWVSNQRHMESFSLWMEAWTLDTWYDRLTHTSIIGMLLVESDDEFNRQITHHIWDRPEARKLPLVRIDSAYEALEWIAYRAPSMVPDLRGF